MKAHPVQPLDLMQFINTKYHDPFIHELLEFESALNAEKLIEAVDILACAFPLLKCSYDEKHNTFTENEDFSGRDLVRINDNADKNMLLTEALDMDKKLIQLTLSKNILVITISHMICDGNGFKQLIYLLCDLYNGATGDNLEHLMNREFSQLTKGLSGKAAMTLKMLLSMMGNYKSKPVYCKTVYENSYVMERIIRQEVMSNVHDAAKNQGSTLNDVFLTAYARALWKLYGLKKLIFHVRSICGNTQNPVLASRT